MKHKSIYEPGHVYEPIRQHFQMLIEYINILEQRRDVEDYQAILFLVEMINNIQRHATMYLNYPFLSRYKKND